MTALTSRDKRQQLINEGYRLHMAISAWGAKKGVHAYRVMSATGEVFFEVYDPKTKVISHDFPAKIRLAIDSHAEALDAYARWSRDWDAGRCKTKSHPATRPRLRFCQPTDKHERATGEVGERD